MENNFNSDKLVKRVFVCMAILAAVGMAILSVLSFIQRNVGALMLCGFMSYISICMAVTLHYERD